MPREKAHKLWRAAELAINDAICETGKDDMSEKAWIEAGTIQRFVEHIVEETQCQPRKEEAQNACPA